ncbi:MAG: YlbF family regulator [Smithella sp.]
MERASREDVIKASREFGEALSRCSEIKALIKAQEAYQKNKKTRELVSEYTRWQRLAQMQNMRGTGLSQEQMAELNRLESELNSNLLIKNFNEARKMFQETMINLNAEISGLLGIDFSANSFTGGGCC